MATRGPRLLNQNIHNNAAVLNKKAGGDVENLKGGNVRGRRPALVDTTNKTSSLWSQKEKKETEKPQSKIPVFTKKDSSSTRVTRSSLRLQQRESLEKEKESDENISACIHGPGQDGCSMCSEVERFAVIKSSLHHVVKGEAEADSHRFNLCSEYTDELHQYMRMLETRYLVRPDYLNQQKEEIKPRMRQVLTHWMMQVADRFELLPETKYLAITLLDRYLEVSNESRRNLQLVGGTSLLLASKYEEMLCPEINDFVYIADKAYTHHDVIKMELKMLRALDFSFGRPLPINFLRRLTKVLKSSPQHHTMAKYLLELSLLDYESCHFRPSQQAAAASYLTQIMLSNGRATEWSDVMTYNSGFELYEVMDCVKRMSYLATTAGSHKYLKLVYDKYANSKNEFVSQHKSWQLDCVKEFAAEHLEAASEQKSSGAISSSTTRQTSKR